MATQRISIRGGDELKRALARLEKGLRDEALMEATKAGVDVLAEEWRSLVPVDDANYQNAIEAKARPGRRGATGVVQIGNAPGVRRDQQPRRYAPRLEFGGLGIPAHPSLRPAIDNGQHRAVGAAADVLARLIEEAT